MLQKIFFIHIPKTGGTTLDWGYLQKVYGHEDRFCETDAFGAVPGRNIYAELRRLGEFEGVPFQQAFSSYIIDGNIPDVTLYSGHMGYGAHLSFREPYAYITVIRNPLDRLRSFIDLQASFNRTESPLTLATCTGKDYDNWQVRCLCLEGWSAKETTEAMLEEAISNLSNMLYGVTDELDEFGRLLINHFAWPIKHESLTLNRTVPHEPVKCYPMFRYIKAEISDKVVEIINQRNQLDWRLYEYAKRTWKSSKVSGPWEARSLT